MNQDRDRELPAPALPDFVRAPLKYSPSSGTGAGRGLNQDGHGSMTRRIATTRDYVRILAFGTVLVGLGLTGWWVWG